MKLTTNQHSITGVKTNWDGEKNCVITNLVIEATVFGEEAAKTANSLKSGESWLTLSSAPVRAVKRDEDETPHFCQEHKGPFEKHEKDGKVWYSHKFGDGPKDWCHEKEES